MCTFILLLFHTKLLHKLQFIFRCTRFRFGPLKSEQILPRLKHVAESENVSLTRDGEKALISLSGGDMRKVKKPLYWLSKSTFYLGRLKIHKD